MQPAAAPSRLAANVNSRAKALLATPQLPTNRNKVRGRSCARNRTCRNGSSLTGLAQHGILKLLKSALRRRVGHSQGVDQRERSAKPVADFGG